jgi:hypothetical protein
MKRYTSMFYWENMTQLNTLLKYRNTFHQYVDAYRNEQNTKISELRTKLIIGAPKAESALLSANLYHWMDYGSRAGGYRRMSITHELPEFVKNQFSTLGSDDDTLQKIDDIYLRAIAIYDNNKLRSLFNIINPFLYINSLVRILFSPIFAIFDIKPINQDSGIWLVLQIIFRLPAYYITVIHPLIILFGGVELEKQVINNFLNYF